MNKTNYSIAQLQNQANEGNAQAQFDLACLYASGEGIEKNKELALSWLNTAAGQGHVEGQLALGWYYSVGSKFNDLLLINDNDIFLRMLKREFLSVMEQVSPASSLVAELIVRFGDPVDLSNVNLTHAMAWFKKAAEQNCAEAQYQLAKWSYPDSINMLEFDDSHHVIVNQHKEEAYELKKQAAKEWYLKAAAQGHVKALEVLADEYKDSDAENRLILCYLQDLGSREEDEWPRFERIMEAVPKSHPEANAWLADTFIHLAIPKEIMGKGKDEEYYQYVVSRCREELQGTNDSEANFLLGVCYYAGKGEEQNDKQAFECFEKADETIKKRQKPHGVDHSMWDFIGLFMKACRSQGKGTAKSEMVSIFNFRDWDWGGSDNESVHLTRIFGEGFHGVPYFTMETNKMFLMRLNVELYKKAGEYQLAENFINESFEKDKNSMLRVKMDSNFKDELLNGLCKEIDHVHELEEKNKQLDAANKLLLEKEKELEDMMSMFAHKFRSPLDAIIYNTTHENQVKMYAEAAQTMRGLLDIFSMISTDEDTLKAKITQDSQGTGSLMTVFSKTLNTVLLHLLSKSGAEKIQQHYMAFAKAHGQCDEQVSYKAWCEDYFELEQTLQAEWEQSFAQLLSQSATLEQCLAWVKQHFFKLELIGFDRIDIQFKEYGVTESLLTILLNEILVNAFKYYSSASKQSVVLELAVREGYQVLICRNPSIRSERMIIKGGHKGHAFLSALARKTGSAFTKPAPQDGFIVEFGIPDELLRSK